MDALKLRYANWFIFLTFYVITFNFYLNVFNYFKFQIYNPEFIMAKIIPKDAKALETMQYTIWSGRFRSLLSMDRRLL